jgi:hypothetical protein
MREYWDRFIRDEKHLAAVIDYIHDNPVKAGLCDQPEKWRWSSVGLADLNAQNGNSVEEEDDGDDRAGL